LLRMSVFEECLCFKNPKIAGKVLETDRDG